MKPDPWRDQWLEIVIRDPLITNACRVLLMVLVRSMREDGMVSRSRSELADELAIDPRRVTERLTEAVGAGLLRRVVEGRPGQYAVYQAARPEGAHVRTKPRRQREGAYVRTERARSTAPCEGAHVRTISDDEPAKSHAHKGAHVRPAITTEPQRSDAAETTGSNVASATENPTTTDESSSSSRSRRRREQAPKATGLSSPSAPPTQADDAATSDSKVTAGFAVAAVARPPKPETAPVEGAHIDDYDAARYVLGRIEPGQRDKCMAIAHNALTNPSRRDLILYAADIARSEIEIAS